MSWPPPAAPVREPEPSPVVFGGLEDIEMPEVASWFEHALLPIGGELILHGWAKSFKSFLALDMLVSLATGTPWCGFAPTEEPCKVCVVQFEIPPKYYRDRIQMLRRRAPNVELFEQNFGTWTPLQRPQLIAGNREQEDYMRRRLVEAGVQVVLIDPVRRALGPKDMNSEQDVRKLLGFFESLQNEGITVATSHHDNKSGGRHGGGNALDMTGSGAFAGDFDTVISVSMPKGETPKSTRRNLTFLTRNGPMINDRAMEMQEDGTIVYHGEPYVHEGGGDDDVPRI